MIPRLFIALLLLAAAPATLACRGQVPQQERIGSPAGQPALERTLVDSSFGRLIDKLSEPAGYFDTDNLISNEASYLHVVGRIRELNTRDGAYIGVGPDQNFSYIAHIRPQIAFIIDIRRDNLLQHLWFKALFELADNRVQFLALMFGKPLSDKRRWGEANLEEVIDYIDATPSRLDVIDANRKAIHTALQGFGIALSENDLHVIERIHSSFLAAGLDLRFTSHNRPPRAYYPTYRQLLLERDLTGQARSYLADERSFRIVKRLQEQDRIIPVVGDLAGSHAVQAIGQHLAEQGWIVSAFYTSNVEFYLMRNGTFDRFAENVQHLPYDNESLIIRSYFGGWYRRQHPQAVPGYFSTQLLHPLGGLLSALDDGGYVSYFDLVTRHSLELQ
jgi:hypothetical protein